MDEASVEKRISEIERILSKLSYIQEEQSKQTHKLIETVEEFKTMSVFIEQNTKDLINLHEKINKLENKMHSEKEESLQTKINEKMNLDKEMTARFWKAISITTTIIIIVFGYYYKEIKDLKTKYDLNELKCAKFEERFESMKKDYEHIKEKIYEIKRVNYGRSRQ